MLALFGTLVCLSLTPRSAASGIVHWRRRWLRVALILAITTFGLGAGVLAAQVSAVESDASWVDAASRLLGESRFGAIWLAREVFLLSVCLLLAIRRTALGPKLALIAAGATLVISPLSSHSAAVEPAAPLLVAHATHLLAAGAWWGALPALAALLADRARGALEPGAALATFARFSALALPLMIAIMLSGTLLALTHVERWPALLATRYGVLLLVKIGLLALVLSIAAKLRWRVLPALET